MKKGTYTNIENKIFGWLTTKTFVEITYRGSKPLAWWKCICKCGKEVLANAHDLKRGHKKSCGCLNADAAKRRGIALRKGDETVINQMFGAYKNQAKYRNLKFDLKKMQFEILVRGSCFYCGVEPYRIYRRKVSHYAAVPLNGIDRRNNAEGYTKENSVTCCPQCNFGKKAQSEDQFLAWVSRIYEYQNR